VKSNGFAPSAHAVPALAKTEKPLPRIMTPQEGLAYCAVTLTNYPYGFALFLRVRGARAGVGLMVATVVMLATVA
jgi:hypothetical protein